MITVLLLLSLRLSLSPSSSPWRHHHHHHHHHHHYHHHHYHYYYYHYHYHYYHYSSYYYYNYHNIITVINIITILFYTVISLSSLSRPPLSFRLTHGPSLLLPRRSHIITPRYERPTNIVCLSCGNPTHSAMNTKTSSVRWRSDFWNHRFIPTSPQVRYGVNSRCVAKSPPESSLEGSVVTAKFEMKSLMCVERQL